MAVALDRRDLGPAVNPATGRRRTVIGSLRNVAACALGGAVITGVALGHDIGGHDPRDVGAIVGAMAGFAGWIAGRL